MPANSGWWGNIAKFDPTTGDVVFYRNLLAQPTFNFNCYVNQMIPAIDGTNSVFCRSVHGSFTTLSRIDEYGSGRWHIDGVYNPGSGGGLFQRTFCYDASNDVIVAIMGTVASHYELRGIDATTGATIWSRMFPTSPTGPMLDSCGSYNSLCIVIMESFGGSYTMRSVDTLSGVDVWSSTAAYMLRVRDVDAGGNWLSQPNGANLEKRSGTTGAVLATASFSSYSAKNGPVGYSITNAFFASPAARSTTGMTFAGGMVVSTVGGGTINTQYDSCGDASGNYYFVGVPTTTGSGPINVFKVNSSGTALWWSLAGVTASAQSLHTCALSQDGYLWAGGTPFKTN